MYVVMFVIMRKRDVCIKFSAMDVNSIPNLRPVVSLSKNLVQSEKAWQTVDTEFNTGNAFGKYCQRRLQREKTNVNKEEILWIFFIR